MPGLTFDKRELGNLEYSLQREMLATDRRGGYMSTTIVGCNTRKYHGLIVAPIDSTDNTYVLLSSLDETIVQHDQSFNLALHRYRGTYEPRGHKYITDFGYTPTPTITYRVGGVILRKELLWIHKRTHLMIRYTLVDAHSETTLRLRPFLAFRNKHELSKANMYANARSYPVKNGVKNRLYDGFPWLYMQLSKDDSSFVPALDWYYDFEYQKEIERGYEGHEDLLTTGYFEMKIRKGESIIFSASVDEMASGEEIRSAYETSIARRTHKIDFLSCLHHSARQFIIRRPGDRTEVVAGYPWYGTGGRTTFISLPGLTLEQGYKEDCMAVLDTMVGDMRNGDFAGQASAEVAADAPLWFFWTLQQLERHIGAKALWEKYGEAMKSILTAYRRGFFGGCVALHDNGLIWASREGYALTWMNNVENGVPVIRREGYAVEVNALWYNAVSYTLALASKMGDQGVRVGLERAACADEKVVRRTFRNRGRGLARRLYRRTDAEPLGALQPDCRMRTRLYDARRRTARERADDGAPASAYAQRVAFAFSAGRDVRVAIQGESYRARGCEPQRCRVGMAFDVLRAVRHIA